MNPSRPRPAMHALGETRRDFFVGQSSLIRPSCIGLTLALAIVAGCKKGDSKAAAAGGMPPPLVTVVTAVAQDVPIYIDEPVGKVVASEMVTIKPQVTGMLMARNFDDGADVTKGCTLFEIDKRPFDAALAAAQATLLENQAARAFAKSDFERVEHLTGTSAVSQQEFDQKKNALAVADAKVKAGEAAVDTANLNLQYCQIRSPIEGRAGQRLVDPGNVVSSSGPNGGTNMLTIQKLDPVYADFTITEIQLAKVRQFMSAGSLKVQVDLPSDAANRAAATAAPAAQASAPTTAPSTQPIEHREGQLIFLDNSVQDGTGTVKLRAQVPNADRHFWPGQFVHVRLILQVKKDAVLIPNQATQISQQGPYVYVMKPDGTADLRPITAGQRQGDMVVVDSGVSAGENVIVSGQLMVIPGKPVRTGPPPGMPGAPGAAPAGEKNAQSKKVAGGGVAFRSMGVSPRVQVLLHRRSSLDEERCARSMCVSTRTMGETPMPRLGEGLS